MNRVYSFQMDARLQLVCLNKNRKKIMNLTIVYDILDDESR